MIKLDDNYTIENNTIHGVELVHNYKVEKEKDGEVKQIERREVFYYPNPVLAIQKYIAITSNKCNSLESLEQHLKDINIKLDNIQEQFKNNNRKV